MRKISYLLAILMTWCVFKVGILDASEKTLTYHSFADENTSGAVIAEVLTKYRKASDGQTVLTRQKQFEQCLTKDEFTLDKDYALVQWARTCPEEETDFTAKREGAVLIVQGQLKGKPVNKNIDLGLKPLYVYPEYNLTRFVLSDMRKIEFWTLRRDELDKLPMQARKEGEETIVVNGKEIEAVKVYYSIVGKLREKYYYRYCYYRKSDGAYIKQVEPKGRTEMLIKED